MSDEKRAKAQKLAREILAVWNLPIGSPDDKDYDIWLAAVKLAKLVAEDDTCG